MIEYSDNDGLSIKDAIKIIGAKNSQEGIDAEYYLINQIFRSLNKSWEREGQSLIKENDRVYDQLIVRDEEDIIYNVWFDITDFYGIF